MDGLRVLAGDCTVIEDGDERRERRGRVVVVVKPDDTVLVHDRTGYQPVAWLTRADAVVWGGAMNGGGATSGGDAVDGADGPATVDRRDRPPGAPREFALVARKDDHHLRVAVHEETALSRYATSEAGRPAGACPDCGGALVRSGGTVACVDCPADYSIPGDADLRGDRCACGLPRMRVERGTAFDLCVDRDCESLDEAAIEAFDREWTCPACGGDLRVFRRGGLLAGCERYPDCDTTFAMPRGTVTGDCDCGLPVFDAPGGRRCLDAACERATVAAEGD
jgi:DNA topoisomerase-1